MTTPQEPAMGVSDALKVVEEMRNVDPYEAIAYSDVEEWAARLTAALQHMQPAGEAVANGKLVGWWNGISPDATGRSLQEPSVRWGADGENSHHDIPLYDGYNPIHYRDPSPTPPPSSAEPQQEARVLVEFPGIGIAGPFPVVDGKIELQSETMADLRAAQQEAQGAVASSVRCPECGSDNVTNHGAYPHDTFLALAVDCNACGHKWEERPATQPAPVDVRLREIIARKRAEADRDEDAADELGRFDSERRDDLRRAAKALRADADEIDLALLSAQQPSADAGDADEERLLGPLDEHLGRAYIDACCVEGVWTHPDHVFEFVEKRARELHQAALGGGGGGG